MRSILREKASEALFDALSDLTLLRVGGEDDFSAKLGVQRRVFDNNDILNSYTVVDRTSVQGSIPIVAWPISVGAFGEFGFHIGTEVGLEFINIRQVLPSRLALLPDPKAQGLQLEQEPWFQEYKKLQPPSAAQPPPPDEETPSKDWSHFPEFQDPEDCARYSRFWNLLSFPLRLPLKAEMLAHLENGEIISYLGKGSVQMGPEIGFDLDPTHVTALAEFGASYSLFVRGTHRISVLKEDERFVRVKVSRSRGAGTEWKVGGEYTEPIFEGVLVLENLQREIKIIPFKLDSTHTTTQSFDVGYRFDLTQPEAKEAYELAVLGRFARSQELAKGSPSAGVQRVFDRSLLTKEKHLGSGMKLGFIFRNNTDKTLKNASATITLPDGTHHVFSSSAHLSRQWRFFLGINEKMEHNFTVNLDLDSLQRPQPPENAFNFIVEGRMRDTDTFGTEMLRYELEVEDAVGKPNIFPRMPPVKYLGSSNFYYSFQLNRPQLDRFIQTPEEKMWPILEKAFGVREGSWKSVPARMWYGIHDAPFYVLNLPLYLTGFHVDPGLILPSAKRFKNRWMKLQTSTDPVKQAENLGKLFYDRFFGHQMVRVLRGALDGESVFFFASGHSLVFGDVVDSGGTQLTFENIATRAQREIEFDREGPKTHDLDPSIQVTKITTEQPAPKRIVIHFDLAQAPAALFIQVRHDNWWLPFQVKAPVAIILKNTGQFMVGTNTLVLDPADPSNPLLPLAEVLKPGQDYLLGLASNNDGLHWGPLASVKLHVKNGQGLGHKKQNLGIDP